jgi:hypothetical protein
MDEKIVEVDMDVNMDELGRKELQALAKSFGIRANQTSEKIKLAILQRKEKIVVECEESPVVDNEAVVNLLVTNVENEIDETIAGKTKDGRSIVVPPNDDMNDTTVIMPTVSSSTISTTLDVPIDQTTSSPSVASVLISTVVEEQQEHKLILVEDQNRPTISSPALPPSSALVSSPISDRPNNDVEKTYDGDDDNDNGNGSNNDNDDNSHISSLNAECNDDSDGNNDSLSDKNDCDDNANEDDDDNDDDEPIEGDNVNSILVPDKEPFKASDDHIVEQSTSVITFLNVNSDDNDDNKDVSSPDGEICDEKQDDDSNECNDGHKDVSSPDGEVRDKNQDDDNNKCNNKCNDDNNDVSSPDGEVYHENQNDDNDNSDSPSDENNNGEDKRIEEGDSDVSNTIVPDKEPFIANTKKDDTIKKSKMTNEKFVTKLPKYVIVKSIVRQKMEVPLWRVHSKDFYCSKGTVRRDKGPGQIKTKPPSKQMRHPLQDRQNKKCPESVVTATKYYKAVAKKVVPMAMSKRNEEQVQKFLHRQSKGRQDRSKILDAKKYAGIA